MVLVYLLAQQGGRAAPTRLVLAGVAIDYVLSAVTSYLVLRSATPGGGAGGARPQATRPRRAGNDPPRGGAGAEAAMRGVKKNCSQFSKRFASGRITNSVGEVSVAAC
jgi:hypothetical protein